MLEAEHVEELICLVSSMDRDALMRHFLSFRGSFPVDFTPDFLSKLSLDRMRHIYVALCLQSQQTPVMTAA
jgi:hypothetical protein